LNWTFVIVIVADILGSKISERVLGMTENKNGGIRGKVNAKENVRVEGV
jgi:hydrogenase maturation factor HypE